MKQYLISHGLSGGFGGAHADFISSFRNENEAFALARQYAVEDYESYEGSGGIRGYSEICEEDGYEEYSSDADQAYNEEMDSWLDYSADEVYQDEAGVWKYKVTDEEVEYISEISISI